MRDDAALDHGAEADCVEQVAGPDGAAGASGEELGQRAADPRGHALHVARGGAEHHGGPAAGPGHAAAGDAP